MLLWMSGPLAFRKGKAPYAQSRDGTLDTNTSMGKQLLIARQMQNLPYNR